MFKIWTIINQVRRKAKSACLVWLERIRKPGLWALLLLVGGVIALVWYWDVRLPWSLGPAPVQPIEFSHRVHVVELELDCRFCHFGAETEARAGLPSPAICWDCHQQVGRSSIGLQPLLEWVEEGVPLYWARVYRLPDHVFFHHGIHTQAGVACIVCHPRIGLEDRTAIDIVPRMRFCVGCHRRAFGIVKDKESVFQIQPFSGGKAISVKGASTDCSACHR